VARTPAILQRWPFWDWLTSCFGSGTAYEKAEDEREDTELGVPEPPPKMHTVGQDSTVKARIGRQVHGGLQVSARLCSHTARTTSQLVSTLARLGSHSGLRETFTALCSSVGTLERRYIVSNNFLGEKGIRDTSINAARRIRTTFRVDTRFRVIDSDRDQTPFYTLTSDGPLGLGQSYKDIDLDTDLTSNRYL
jgi:hypothetical protein